MDAPAACLRLPADEAFIRAGIEYAKRTLGSGRLPRQWAPHLRTVIAAAAIELAFRRWLETNAVPYQLFPVNAFTNHPRSELLLGGRRCHLQTTLIGEREVVNALRCDRRRWQSACVWLPESCFQTEKLTENDLCLFGLATMREMRRADDWRQIVATGQPHYLLHAPRRWRSVVETLTLPRVLHHPPRWKTLGRLSVMNNTMQPLTVEVGGQDVHHSFIAAEVSVAPRSRSELRAEFFTCLYAHVPTLPQGMVSIYSPARRETLLIAPFAWHNLWLYDAEFSMVGWLTRAEMRRRSHRLPAGVRLFPGGLTPTIGRSVPVTDLHPLTALAELLRPVR